ncbi:hypothetical protein Tco_1219979 [Tanacetum coccineum]
MLPTLPSTPTPSPAELSGEPMMRRYRREAYHYCGSSTRGYDGLPLQPVAPPSPDFILGPENPQTPPVPQEEDEREPIFRLEEQPLPPIDSPTAESPGYVTESDPEEDPEEYEDEYVDTRDVRVDVSFDDGGDDGDDYHLRPLKLAPYPFPPEARKSSCDDLVAVTTTITALLSVIKTFRRSLSSTLNCKEARRLLGTLRIASTQALIDAEVTDAPFTTLPPPLPTYPPISTLPPPIDVRVDIPKVLAASPQDGLHLSTIYSNIGEVPEDNTYDRGRGSTLGFESEYDNAAGQYTYGDRMTLPGDRYGWWRRKAYASSEARARLIGLKPGQTPLQELQTICEARDERLARYEFVWHTMSTEEEVRRQDQRARFPDHSEALLGTPTTNHGTYNQKREPNIQSTTPTQHNIDPRIRQAMIDQALLRNISTNGEWKP